MKYWVVYDQCKEQFGLIFDFRYKEDLLIFCLYFSEIDVVYKSQSKLIDFRIEFN